MIKSLAIKSLAIDKTTAYEERAFWPSGAKRNKKSKPPLFLGQAPGRAEGLRPAATWMAAGLYFTLAYGPSTMDQRAMDHRLRTMDEKAI
jgi:hypothetical protein